MRIAGVVDIDLPAERNHEVTLTREFAEHKRAFFRCSRTRQRCNG
jgi:hypothetical protein